MLKNKKILITGGAGFIGSHLVDHLLNLNINIKVYDNFLRGNKLSEFAKKNVEIIEADVRDSIKLDSSLKEIDYVFHLAAYLGVESVAANPIETMEVESIGTFNIVRSSLKHNIEKIIYVSTSGVYGKIEIDKAVDEDFLVSPSSSYAIAKRYNEIYLKSVYNKFKVSAFSLRYFNVYGPRQDDRMVLPKFFDQAINNNDITVYGNGNQTRDFTYIDDTVRSTLLIADLCNGSEIINIAKGEDISINELASEVISVTNSKSNIKNIEAPNWRYDFDVEKRCGDSNKLKKLTNYIPNTPLREGLEKTYNFILKNK